MLIQERKQPVNRTYLLAPVLTILKHPCIPAAACQRERREVEGTAGEAGHPGRPGQEVGGGTDTDPPAAQQEGERGGASSAAVGATRVGSTASPPAQQVPSPPF